MIVQGVIRQRVGNTKTKTDKARHPHPLMFWGEGVNGGGASADSKI